MKKLIITIILLLFIKGFELYHENSFLILKESSYNNISYLVYNNLNNNPCDNGYNLVIYENNGYCVKPCYIGTTPLNGNPFRCSRQGGSLLKGFWGYVHYSGCVDGWRDTSWFNGKCDMVHGATTWHAECPCGMHATTCCDCKKDNVCCGDGNTPPIGRPENEYWEYCRQACYNVDTGETCPNF